LNTASLQIVPATIAAVRASLKAAAPFDILPAVWISSFASLIAGLTASLISEKLSRRKNGLVSGRIEKEAALQERRQ
jgi:spore maturation protein A